MDECPYCGKETSAVKNHVRLTSGDGHGEYGQYPEDFHERSSGSGETTSADDDDTPGDGRKTANDEQEMAVSDPAPPPESSPEESLDGEDIDDMLSVAREEGYSEGFDEGYDAGQTEWKHQADEDVDESSGSLETCPECGSPMMDGDSFAKDLKEHARESAEARKFVQVNEDAEVQRACSDPYRCGYYIDEHNVAHRFEQPGGSGGWATALGLIGLGAAAVLGLATNNRDDSHDLQDSSRLY